MKISLRQKILGGSIIVILVVLVTLMTIFHKQIIDWLTPFALKLKKLPAGFLIPAAIIIIQSFPPLFGQEITNILVGFVWGLGFGFLIVMPAVVIGESIFFILFRHYMTNRANQFRNTHKENYGVFVQVIESGNNVFLRFAMIFLIRLSIIPSHFTTPLFATMKDTVPYWMWFLATILSSPKLFVPVYVGHLLSQDYHTSVLSDVVFALAIIISIGLVIFVYFRFRSLKALQRTKGAKASSRAASQYAANPYREEDDEPTRQDDRYRGRNYTGNGNNSDDDYGNEGDQESRIGLRSAAAEFSSSSRARDDDADWDSKSYASNDEDGLRPTRH